MNTPSRTTETWGPWQNNGRLVIRQHAETGRIQEMSADYANRLEVAASREEALKAQYVAEIVRITKAREDAIAELFAKQDELVAQRVADLKADNEALVKDVRRWAIKKHVEASWNWWECRLCLLTWQTASTGEHHEEGCPAALASHRTAQEGR